MPRRLRVVARASALARKQVEEVFSFFPGLEPVFVPCESYGDRHREVSLLGDVPDDFFTREPDHLLLDGKGDIAVHSAKDMPATLPEGLALIALTRAKDGRDALVSRGDRPLQRLPPGARVGASSIARKNGLLSLRPDLMVVPVRGTIEERISLVDRGQLDALVVAACALQRLNLSHRAACVLPFPAHPLQGSLGVVARRERADLKVLFSAIDVRQRRGKVFLVGAGIGAGENLTLKAEAVLKSADVIVYDDLIERGLLVRFPGRKVYAGKRKGHHYVEQDAINELLWKAAQKRQVIVRLKGGDPFIFGRGGEEMRFLGERHVDVEIVPGISAVQAAAASAQVPLTLRGKSATLTLCSGHGATVGETRAVYMGASKLAELRRTALREFDDATPVALVHNAGACDEETCLTTAGELGAKKGRSPLMVLAGQTAALHVPRPSILYTGLEPHRCLVPGRLVHYPLIEVRPKMDMAVPSGRYDGILFTSVQAVRIFCGRYAIAPHQKILSIGPSTGRELRSFGYRPYLSASLPDSDVLAAETGGLGLRRILYPCSDRSRNALDGVRGVERAVICATRYKRQPKLDLRRYEGIVFTSPSTVTAFFRIYGRIPSHLVLYVYGKHTARALRARGYHDRIQTVPLS